MNGIDLFKLIIDNELLKDKRTLKEFGKVIFDLSPVSGISLKTLDFTKMMKKDLI